MASARKAIRTYHHRRDRRKAKQSAYKREPKFAKGRKKGGHAVSDSHVGQWYGKTELLSRLRWSPHAF